MFYSSKTNKWEIGTFVWGKLNSRYWPGIVIYHKDINFPAPTCNSSLIFWFGDHRVSKLSNSKLVNFCHEFTAKYKRGCMPKTWITAVLEAIRVVGYPDTMDMDDDELVSWAKSHFPWRRNRGDIPSFVKQKLQELFHDNCDKEEECSNTKRLPNAVAERLIKSYRMGNTSSLNICLGCYSADICSKHPIFEGFVCSPCKEKIKERYYVIGADGIKYFCAICARLGDVLVCERPGCRLVYCSVCIDEFAVKGARKQILKQSVWICFVCDNNSNLKGTLILRENWKQNVTKLFTVSSIPSIPIQKKRIKVLSLFDGIGTAFTVLWKLKIEMESYYACEVDTDSIDVVEKNYPSAITQLGDIKNLTEETIKSILPIDLLVGGSPCNDLSAVNPYRRGLGDIDGSGILFFDYYRVLKTIQMYNGRHLFWLFENVSSMTFETKQSMTRFLGCEPMLIDAAWVSAMRRPRLFWGNLPSLQYQDFVDDGPHLQDFLLPGRKAAVDKMQTVTTRSNSLLQGPSFKLPVINEDGTEDDIHISELEDIFGFPKNYTAVNNLSITCRQRLLGKAWSVPVITMLLSCLKDYFKVE